MNNQQSGENMKSTGQAGGEKALIIAAIFGLFVMGMWLGLMISASANPQAVGVVVSVVTNADRELAAQEGAARWAFWAVVLSGAQAIVGGVGLIAIWRSLNHAQKANDLARNNFDSENRAWVKIDIAKNKVFDLKNVNGGIVALVPVTLQNIGSSVAKNVSVVGQIAFLDSNRERGFEVCNGEWRGIGQYRTSDYIFPGEKRELDVYSEMKNVAEALDEALPATPLDGLEIAITIRVLYNTIFDHSQMMRCTEKVFEVDDMGLIEIFAIMKPRHFVAISLVKSTVGSPEIT